MRDFPSALERQMQRELQYALSVSGRNLAKGCVRDRRIRVLELGVIEDIERVSSQLQIDPLCDREVLGNRQVQIRLPRAAQCIPRQSSVRIEAGDCNVIERQSSRIA